MQKTLNQDNEYNGWANYETWMYALWMDNDENSYMQVQLTARRLVSGEGLYDPREDQFVTVADDERAYVFAEYLESRACEEADEQLNRGASWVRDAVNSTIKTINFREIAEHILENPVSYD